MPSVLVIRFGSLGDLCLLGWSLASQFDAHRNAGLPPPRMTVVTKAAFAPLAERVRGVDRVVALEGPALADLRRLARRLRAEPWDLVVDAHNNLRSRLLTALLGRRAQATLRKDTAARLWLLLSRRALPPLRRSMSDRFAQLWDAGPGSRTVEPTGGPPLAATAADGQPPRRGVGLAPGAQWTTKRWPEENFAWLLGQLAGTVDQPATLFLGPREQTWFPTGSLAREADRHPGVRVWQDRPLVETARALAACRLLVTNDSGLLHLAEAVGTPVLACFGPTVRAFGYFPRLAASRVLETDLPCRPCSRNGKRPCHRGDLACLARIRPEQVLAEVQAMLADPTAERAGGNG